jgi:ubiquinone/menaquinone biosynthesis C-methylase UbiE
MDHDHRIQQEFARQAERFGAAPAVVDPAQTQPIVDAVGRAAAARVLDLACGPGIVSAALAPQVGALVAFDLTAEMLDAARRRCAAAGLANVSFERGSATALPFVDAAFDVVVTRLAIHHFERPARVLAEAARVLKPGGRLVVADVVAADDPAKAALQNAIERLRDPSHVRMLPAVDLSRLIADAGFAIDAETTWDKPRELEEWFGIVDDPARVAPLRVLVRALAERGEDAGMGLEPVNATVAFFHRWRLIVARKPAA